MARQLTEKDSRDSLEDHITKKGMGIYNRYGPKIGWPELQLILDDPEFVRYPCRIEFDIEPLQPGECAYPRPDSERPEDGFTMIVHPKFANFLNFAPHVVLYQIAVINYGDFANAEDAENFGASALGISRDEYYTELCRLADLIENV
jgi:hypothetical protein